MKSVIFIFLGFIITSCSTNKDSIVGLWKAKVDYTRLQFDSDQKVCEVFTFDILKTKSSNYFGKVSVDYLDCITGKLTSSSSYTIYGIEFDEPVVIFVIASDNDPSYIHYKFTGVIKGEMIEGKMNEVNSNSSFDILCQRINN